MFIDQHCFCIGGKIIITITRPYEHCIQSITKVQTYTCTEKATTFHVLSTFIDFRVHLTLKQMSELSDYF